MFTKTVMIENYEKLYMMITQKLKPKTLTKLLCVVEKMLLYDYYKDIIKKIVN